MPLTVAFWNINTGTGSSQGRLNTFHNWCAEMTPDLIFLEEVSFKLDRNHLEQATGYTQIGRVGTLDKNNDPSTKDLVTLGDDDYNARPLRFPSLEQRRMLLKVTEVNTVHQGLAIWGIHANASRRGGLDALGAVLSHLAKPSGAGTVVGGDFNSPIANAGASAVHPLDYMGAPMAFTQWNKTAGQTPLHQYGNNRTLYQKIEPHNVIDYVIHGPQRTVVALPNCASQQRWTDILVEFDHAPVLYQITA